MLFVINTILLLAVTAPVVYAEPFDLSRLCTESTEQMAFKVHITVDNSSNQYDAEWFIVLNTYSSYTIICGDYWVMGHGTAGNLYMEMPVTAPGQFNSAGVYHDANSAITYKIVEMFSLGNQGNPNATLSSTFRKEV